MMKHFFAILLFICMASLPSCDLYSGLMGDDSDLESGITTSRITNTAGTSEFPSLVWTGSEYGIAWDDTRDGLAEIYFARVNTSGVKQGSDVRITNAAGSSFGPSLVWTGSEYGVCWQDNRAGNEEIYFARISASGVKQGGDVRVTNTGNVNEKVSLVWNGSGYGVAWDDTRNGNSDIYFAQLNASGVKQGGDVRVTSDAGNSIKPSLVWNGSGYGVSWHDDRDGNHEIYFARLNISGVSSGDIRITTDLAASRGSSLVWTGSEYGVCWDDNRVGELEIYFARLNTSGTKLGGDDIQITTATGPSILPSLIWTGSGYGVSWQDSRDGNDDIYFTRISATGVKLDSDIRITNDAGSSTGPVLVWTGSEFGACWQDDRNGNWNIYFARIVP